MSPIDVEGWLKVGAAFVTFLGVAWATLWGPLARWRAKRRARREEQERTIRYLADAVHALLRARVHRRMPDGDNWMPDADDLAQQAVRIYEQRNVLFRADGHEPPTRPTKPLTEAEVVVLIRRTQAIKDMQDRQTPDAQ